MKWLKNDAYDALNAAAKNWNNLLQKIQENNPDMKAEDITPDLLLETMENVGSTQQQELQTQLDEAQNDILNKDAEIERLTAENNALKGTPKGSKSDVEAKTEPLGEGDDIKDFAEKNSGDTLAIMAQAEKDGFFNY